MGGVRIYEVVRPGTGLSGGGASSLRRNMPLARPQMTSESPSSILTTPAHGAYAGQIENGMAGLIWGSNVLKYNIDLGAIEGAITGALAARLKAEIVAQVGPITQNGSRVDFDEISSQLGSLNSVVSGLRDLNSALDELTKVRAEYIITGDRDKARNAIEEIAGTIIAPLIGMLTSTETILGLGPVVAADVKTEIAIATRGAQSEISNMVSSGLIGTGSLDAVMAGSEAKACSGSEAVGELGTSIGDLLDMITRFSKEMSDMVDRMIDRAREEERALQRMLAKKKTEKLALEKHHIEMIRAINAAIKDLIGRIESAASAEDIEASIKVINGKLAALTDSRRTLQNSIVLGSKN